MYSSVQFSSSSPSMIKSDSFLVACESYFERITSFHDTMNSFFDDSDDEVAERCPNSCYLRYHEVVGECAGKTAYKGFDENHGREITWTKIRISEGELESSEEHVKSLNKIMQPLRHVNIFRYYAGWVDRDAKVINMITEAFSSGSLRSFRRKHRSVDMTAITSWFVQILRGLCYLHTHQPPITHGKLNCENIFVNGHTGEVKIGDLGFANMIQKQEENEENYNESGDVFLFGICMLELVTYECPCSGYNSSPYEIYQDIIAKGTLAKVKDTQLRLLIQKCLLVPVSSRLTVMELLEDSFFTNPRVPPRGGCAMRVGGGAPLGSSFEISKSTKVREFRLKGERNEEKILSLRLRITEGGVKKGMQNIEFVFDLDVDTTIAVAQEMMVQLALSKEDARIVAGLMDALFMRLVPYWMLSLSTSGNVNSSSLRDSAVTY